MKHLTPTQDDLLKSAQFHPVFNEHGEIEGISQLKVATDRRLGIRAMEELAATVERGDEAVFDSGWTGKQLRILNSAAPATSHYLKPSKKYDAATGDMLPKMTIILPFEVTWRLFELLFDGQYSIDIGTVETSMEDVLPIGKPSSEATNDPSKKGDDAPGRLFYSSVEVTVTLHLKNGTSRKFSGLGVAYDHVRMEKLGNVFAINSARRTTEKGAVSDAKREALSNMGRVFRRAYEDGDEMIQKFEELLMDTLRETNQGEKPARSATPEVVPAPKPKARVQKPAPKAPQQTAAETPAEPPAAKPGFEDDEIPFGNFEPQEEQRPVPQAEPEESKASPDESKPFSLLQDGKEVQKSDDADLIFDRAADILSEMETADAAGAFFEENKDELARAEKASKAGNSYDALHSMVMEALDPETEAEGEQNPAEKAEDKTSDEGDQQDWQIVVDKPTGTKILDGYTKAFKKAKSAKDVDAILEANTELAKRLTKGQAGKLLKATMEAKSKLS